MEPTRELIDSIHRDKIERARRASIDEKFRDGLDLFDLACRLMADGIRMQFPGITDAQVQVKIGERLALLDRSERGE